MDTLTNYLAKYRSLVPPEASKKRLVASVVRDECGVVLDEAHLSLRGGGVHLTCHPIARSEVARSAPQILTTLQREHGVRLSFIR